MHAKFTLIYLRFSAEEPKFSVDSLTMNGLQVKIGRSNVSSSISVPSSRVNVGLVTPSFVVARNIWNVMDGKSSLSELITSFMSDYE